MYFCVHIIMPATSGTIMHLSGGELKENLTKWGEILQLIFSILPLFIISGKLNEHFAGHQQTREK